MGAGDPRAGAPGAVDVPVPAAETVTFLFADIEGSTHILERAPETYPRILEDTWRLLREAAAAHGGEEFGAEGDAMFFAFASPGEAIAAAVDGQRAMRAHDWPEHASVRVRMGVHTGEAVRSLGTWIGLAVHQTARTSTAGHGGQVVVSASAVDAAGAAGVGQELVDLGEYRLRDIAGRQRLFQVSARGLETSFPPLRTATADVTNLPNQLTTFVGRQAEMRELRGALARHRLITLTGPGGVGKTRLALEAAGAAGPDFADGVWIVELGLLEADASDATTAAVVRAAARALRVATSDSANDVGDVGELVTAIGARHVLLVVDNCEHVVDSVARVVGSLLSATPNVTVLATSREALNVRGERVWPVPPLAPSDAARLFADRAALVRTDAVFSEADHAAVVDLCQRLDSVPLAIELAAARAASLSVDQIAARIDDRFRLLAGGPRNAEPRQRSLRAAIAWSYDLLDEPERAVLRRLSVFAGPWSIDAGASVAGDGPDDVGTGDLIDALARKSLLTVLPCDDGSLRLRMLESVREFAHEKLVEAEEVAATRDRVVSWSLTTAAAALPDLSGPRQAATLDHLDDQLPNLRVGLDWAITVRPDDGLELAGLLAQFFGVRGHLAEGRTWLERAIAVADLGTVDPMVALRALTGAGTIARIQGDLDAAAAHHRRQLDVARSAALEGEVGRALNAIATVHLAADDVDAARPLLEESLAIRRRLGDQRSIALTLNNLGALASIEGDEERARAYYREHLEIMRAAGNVRVVGQSLHNVAKCDISLGDTDEARALLDEAIGLLESVGDRRSVSITTSLLACLERIEGRHDEALRLHRDGLAGARDLGDAEALSSHLEGIAAVMASGIDRDNCLVAARLLGAASTIQSGRADRGTGRTGSADPWGCVESEASVRRLVGDKAFDAAFEAGVTAGVEAVADEAVTVASRILGTA